MSVMGTPQTAPDANVAKPDAADVEAVIEFSGDFMAARLSQLGTVLSILERQFKCHENGAAFYEKVILFDGATIGLSFTLLSYLSAHQAHLPRLACLWLVCPAWVLLLISMFYCAMTITSFLNTSTTLLKHFSAVAANYHLQNLGLLANRVSARIKGGFQIPNQTGEQVEAKQVFSQVGGLLMKEGADQNTKIASLLREASTFEKIRFRFGVAGMSATILSLLILCVFALLTLIRTL
jgi:hypothetical protein